MIFSQTFKTPLSYDQELNQQPEGKKRYYIRSIRERGDREEGKKEKREVERKKKIRSVLPKNNNFTRTKDKCNQNQDFLIGAYVL